MPRILIADDEPNVLFLLERSISMIPGSAEMEIIKAVNGQDALDLIQSRKPDLVLLDVMMPQMNGFDVCRKVKKELAMEGVTIIMLTAKGQDYDRALAKECGADRYYQKPFDPMELMQTVREVLKV